MAYPTYANILTYCQAFGIDCPAQTIVEDFIDASTSKFDTAIGYQFLNTNESTTTYQFPVNGNLILPHHTAYDTVKIDGVATTDYDVFPWGLRFGRNGYGRVVTIIGTIGYADVPQRLFQLIIKMVLWEILTINPTKNITEVKLASQTIKMGEWFSYQDEFDALVQEYRW